MPKLSNSLPKYRKHRASGQAVVTLSGVDRYLGRHGTRASRAMYDRLVSEWLLSGRSASYCVASSSLTVADLLLAFLDFAHKFYGNGPKSQYHHYVRIARPIKDLYGGTPASEFDPLRFKTIRERLVGEGVSRGYVNACMNRAARIFRWAAGEAMIPVTVLQALGKRQETFLARPLPLTHGLCGFLPAAAYLKKEN